MLIRWNKVIMLKKHTVFVLILIPFLLGMFSNHLISKYRKSADKTRESLLRSVHDPTVQQTDYFIIVLIISAPNNYDRRNAIRKTWLQWSDKVMSSGLKPDHLFIPQYREFKYLELETITEQQNLLDNYKKRLDSNPQNIRTPAKSVKHFFAVGVEKLSDDVLTSLEEEQSIYGDLLTIPMDDDYFFLTEKLLQSIKLIQSKYNYRYMLKCDDDSFVKLNVIHEELKVYEAKLHQNIDAYSDYVPPNLYWGYFNGRAQIKLRGKWRENNFKLCDKYLPYALGGGYVIDWGIGKYLSDNMNSLVTLISEDVSVGMWLTPLKSVYRKHDVRFDTTYMPRNCQNYHIVLHKRTIADMFNLYENRLCTFKNANNTKIRRPIEYYYDWDKLPSSCCDYPVN